MNKLELITNVAEKTGFSKKQATEAVEAVLGSIKETSKVEDVKLAGFGVFKPTLKKARTGRNPSTGAAIEIPEKKGVKFKPYF